MSESLWRRTIEAQRKGKTWNEHLVEEQIEDTWQAQVDAGVALAEMAGRVRELEAGVVSGADPVHAPEHYRTGAIECIDAIESALGPEGFEGYLAGNAIKYTWRYKHKGKAGQDLGKARWYLGRLAERKAGL